MSVKPPFDVVLPAAEKAPLVIDCPHSGTRWPDDFAPLCAPEALVISDDLYVDRFATSAAECGATILRAHVTRAYIDLNRALSDLHPDICSEAVPWPITRSKRTDYGMGLIRHMLRPGEPLYEQPLSLAVIQDRIDQIYTPYYSALEQIMTSCRREYGRVLHLSLHAMPALSADGSLHPDIVLGDLDGHSCARHYRETVKRFLEQQGLVVVNNHPYKGAELTRRFSRPRQGFHSLQIEVNKALYMHEDTRTLHEGFDDLTAVFSALWRHIADDLHAASLADAAE